MDEWTPAWFKRAACKDTYDPRFFGTIPEQRQVVKEYCVRCVVRVDCKASANMGGLDMGVWGGIVQRVTRRNL